MLIYISVGSSKVIKNIIAIMLHYVSEIHANQSMKIKF